MNLGHLSNEELLTGLHTLVAQGRVLLARLLAYLGEVEERRLDLDAAYSSLFDFCVRRLGMGDDEAYRRVAAARLVRRFPNALGMIERGEIHMTALLLLREYLTGENGEELLREASGKTKSEVQHLIAERFPRPDAPSRIQPLSDAPALSSQGTGQVAMITPPPTPARTSRVEPLSPERYKVQFTADEDLRAKIERATNLMRHQNPSGDLSVVIDRAMDLLLGELEKQRLGKTTRPSKAPRKSTRAGYVPRAVRREVFERDGEQCTFVDETGRRCEARAFLELDHQRAHALGGDDEATNLAVRCRAHNGLSAERDFGRQHIEKKKKERKIHPRQRDYDDVALRALCGMGFKDAEARRALGIVAKRWSDSVPPLETVLREALSVLA